MKPRVFRWHARRDPKTGLERHRVTAGFGHALLAPVACYAFESLAVAASIWQHGYEWMLLHSEPSPVRAEFAQGRARERVAYNERMLTKAVREMRPVRGERAGLWDYFVPISSHGRCLGVLVVGPFAVAPASSTDLLERWRALTGRQGHPSDPAFADFLDQTLSTLVLSRTELAQFERLLICIARLLVGEGKADALANEVESLRVKLENARSFDHVCRMVREMVDERTAGTWQSQVFSANLERLGLSRPADAALVGLTVSTSPGSDPVDEALRRYRFQRHLVEQTREIPDLVAGQVGNHGIVYLSAKTGSPARRRSALVQLSERAREVARHDFGLHLHFGACVPARSQPLYTTYDEALAAAEAALAKGSELLFAEAGDRPTRSSLRQLRQQLARAVLERPELLRARFDHYLETVATTTGFMTAAARGQLDAGFERIAEPLVGSGALDQRAFDMLAQNLDRSAREARTQSELFAAYRTAVSDIAEAIERPVAARLELRLRRAVDHIERHYTETLSSAAVAKLAGLTRTHFSKLFKEREKKTFVDYVSGLRLERARQLLDDTDLEVARIAELAGFRSPQYFARAFRKANGRSPLEYRSRARRQDRRSQNVKHKLTKVPIKA